MQNQSYFHKINNDLTINLAEVASVDNNITHLELFKQQHPDSFLGHKELESGRTCRITLLRHRTHNNTESGREYYITRAEMTKLQDALEWYNRHFTETEKL